MPGKYQAYPEYNHSGVEWLGKIPRDWKVLRGKFVFSEYGERSEFGDEILLSVSEYYGVKPRGDVIDEGDFLSRAESLVGYKKCKKNDLVMNIMLAWKCGLGVTKYDGIVSPAYSVFRFNEKASPDYMHYLLRTDIYTGHFKTRSTGVIDSRLRLYPDSFADVSLLLPPVTEQNSIANFLDHETAKIDTLIEKQQQLIKLLKEKRQAVISHAVTKGLNPNVSMRDSGVEWLGEVPEHWVVAQLKFNTVEMQTGPFGSQLHAEDYIDDGIPLVNPAHMADGKIVPDSKVSVDEETWHRLKRHQLFEGDLIFARRGELGRCAIVTKDQEGWLCGTGSLKAKLNDRLVPEYSYLLITSDGVVSELSLESKGSTMDNLNTETLGRVRLPVPPIDEQRKVLDYVNDVSGKFRNLIDKASAAIELMKERRTALISAAVTGKIDVRHHASHPAGSANTMMEHNNDF
ncbi:type I restriction enzyme S subunit [Methylobacter tundripaludum]|uniref:Type I restriction enzyme S subunit n=1 Tax=Methylobacter tundripaludum TaxID=173365 RepID=A0A2S6HCI9_9GAMM|nr:restriction endonuclease subunit S [Methylobacter tundripaludum]PPK75170.1 type I restriction enzyme S subunit [Methylobacter tundripaludum]